MKRDFYITYDWIDDAFVIRLKDYGCKVSKCELYKMLECAEKNKEYNKDILPEQMRRDINDLINFQKNWDK